jgi:uncharacterized membrane protein
MTHTRAWLSSGWELVTHHLVAFVVLAVAYAVVMGAASRLYVVHLIIAGPAAAAIFGVVLHRLKTGQLDLNRLEDGLLVFVPAMLAGILVGIFVGIGIVLLIIPGIIISALYLFALPLVVDRRMPFWDAMEESRKRVQQDLLGFVGFVLALIGINLLGVICLGVGVFVSIPVSWCAVAVAYRELWPETGNTGS